MSKLRIANRTSRNVYLLGAGFSAPRGIPVVRNFLNFARDAQEWLLKTGYDREADSIDRLLRFRLEAAASAERMHINLENIEDLFSLASATPDALETQHIVRSVAATIEYASRIKKESVKRIPCKKSGAVPGHWNLVSNIGPDAGWYDVPTYDHACGILSGFFGNIAFDHSTFITLNYDTVLEDSLARLGVPYNLGFSDGSVDYEGRRPDNAGVQVLKLHGSVSWTRRKDAQRLAVFDSYDPISKQGLDPVIIPPTWKKQPDDALHHVWQQAIASIRTASRLVVIGYSFPVSDQNLKYLLAAGLMKNNAIRSILIWDISLKDLEPRLYQLLRPELATREIIGLAHAGIDTAFDAQSTRELLGRSHASPFLDNG